MKKVYIHKRLSMLRSYWIIQRLNIFYWFAVIIYTDC